MPRHGTGNATIVVTIDHHKLAAGVGEATLTTGTTVSPRQVRRLACNAGLLPLMLGADSAILDLGLARRLFDRYQRIALAVRDQGCIFAGCQRPAAWSEAHHITPWSEGGPTDLTNGCLPLQLPPPPGPPRPMDGRHGSRRHPRDHPPDPHRTPPTTHPPPTLQTPLRIGSIGHCWLNGVSDPTRWSRAPTPSTSLLPVAQFMVGSSGNVAT
ncbi:MAG: DUF222 domain-containing protein [Nocardioidaceae bacterium]